MKSIALIVCGLLLVFSASGAVSAQGMPGMPPGGPGPAPGGYMMPGPAAGPGPAPGGFMMPGAPGCGLPFPGPQGCQTNRSDPLSFVSYGGYLYHQEGLTYTRERTGLPSLRFTLPAQGAWLGGAAILPFSEKMGFMASGGILIPSRQSGTVSEEGTVLVPLKYSVSDERDWWYLDGMGYYNVTGCGVAGVLAVAGFRWDHLDSRQNLNWVDAATGGTVDSGSATNNLKINGYLPYFGVQSVYRSSADRLLMRVIGFPYIPGDLKLQESFVETEEGVSFSGGGSFANSPLSVTSGYWVDVFADASRKIANDFWLGGFVRWQYLAGKTDTGRFDVSTTVDSASFSERIIYYTRAWVFGGSLGVDFNLF